MDIEQQRYWAVCPYCGAKRCKYNSTATVHGVYARCKNKRCGREFELIITNGKQLVQVKEDV